MSDFSSVNKRRPRPDGSRLVSGKAIYAGDLVMPQMLHGKILRSPEPHANIVHIDTSKAESLTGVKAVLTGKGILPRKFGIGASADEYGMAIDKVRYVGDPVAAVAAVDEETAAEALELIRVEYQPLTPIFNVEDARQPGAPQIHERGNVSSQLQLEWGDVDKGFIDSDHIREDRFSSPAVQHCAIEPHAMIAYWDLRGEIQLWTANQGAFVKSRALSVALAIPENRIHLHRVYVGGGFGSKVEMVGEVIACVLSQKAQRPVKITYTREEVFTASRQRHAMIIDLKTGVKKDGSIIARQCQILADTGAYSSTAAIVLYLAGTCYSTMYRIPNLKYQGYSIHTNTLTRGPMRGHGHPQLNFACESQLDMVAADIGMDPMELRLKNAMDPGVRLPNGNQISSCELKQSIIKAAEASKYLEKRTADNQDSPRKRGIGMACTTYINSLWLGPHTGSGAFVKVAYDGGVNVITGGADIGQGFDNIMAQIAAEELGIGADEVNVVSGDTQACPADVGAFGSGETFVTGSAVRKAATDTKLRVLEFASELMQVEVTDLNIKSSKVYRISQPETTIEFKTVIQQGYLKGKSFNGKGEHSPAVDRPRYGDQIEGQYTPCQSYGTQVAEVEVDTQTGHIRVIKVVDALDCGTRINPLEVEGQIEGSISMSLGHGLSEEILLDEGRTLNPSFLGYGIPLSVEMPAIECVEVPSYEPLGPFGAKEVGEASAIPTAAAIANAVYHATGVRIKELPLTPEKVLRELEKQESGIRNNQE